MKGQHLTGRLCPICRAKAKNHLSELDDKLANRQGDKTRKQIAHGLLHQKHNKENERQAVSLVPPPLLRDTIVHYVERQLESIYRVAAAHKAVQGVSDDEVSNFWSKWQSRK